MKTIRKTLMIGAAAALCIIATTWAGAAPRDRGSDSSRDGGNEYSYRYSGQFYTRFPDTLVVAHQPEVRVVPIPPRRQYFSVDIDTDGASYYVGSAVRVTFRATHDSYVYIFSNDTRGVTRQIFPNYYDRDNFVRGGRTYSIPDRNYSLIAEDPAGRESLQIVAYRQRYAALDRWHRFDRDEIFPRQSYSNENMRKSIDREIESLRIRPHGYPVWDDGYAEAWTYFTTRYPHRWHERKRRYDPPYVHYPSRNEAYSYREGTIRITSAPSGAEVYIDGVYAGRTPGAFDAAVGKREVILYRAGYKTKEMAISVTKAGETSISVSMQRERW
jgi:hypothetical protein